MASSKNAKKSPKSPAKKAAPAAKKPAVKKVAASKAPDKKTAPKTVKPKAEAAKPKVEKKPAAPVKAAKPADRVATKLTPFLEKQRERLLILKDTLLDNMNGVARDSLRSQSGGDASAFGMHQADAGSDAYDRDFALSLLSQEQDSLYEIDQALKRIEQGSYGVCEMSGKQIPKPRLEALPFTRYTVECQAELEKRNRYQRHRQPVTSLFGLTEDESDSDEEESTSDTKD
jgi:RNA polymerase-binding transcription factor DksA